MYSVILQDGTVYGPVDEAELVQWAQERRLRAATQVRCEPGGQIVEARGLPFLEATLGAASAARGEGPEVAPAGTPRASTDEPSDWLAYWNRKVRRFTIIDVKLVQVGAMAVALAVAKLIPEIMGLSVWWFLAAAVVCLLRPAFVFWAPDDPAAG
jgi:hypothetical protein